jgi:nicotinamidase-related amidase
MADSVKIVDRGRMVSILKSKLTLDPSKTAIVTIDMHRGHLDPSVATMPAAPEDCDRVIAHGKDVLTFARSRKIPVIHIVLTHRNLPGFGSEAMNVPFWRAVQDFLAEEDRLSPGRKSTTTAHNLEGSPGTQIIPDLHAATDYVINNKKRLDCFYGTDLEILLRTLGVDTVVLMGINTNTCVMNTAFSAFNRDFQVVVLADCVASMYGDDLHILGLENVKRCLGYVLTSRELKEKLESEK